MKAVDCIFCKISAGETPAEIVYRDEEMTAFWDHMPGAPVHILIIPNHHIDSLNDAGLADVGLIGRMVLRARELAVEHEIDQSGYRLFINTGPDGRQTVYHLHLHLMGGKHLPIFRG